MHQALPPYRSIWRSGSTLAQPRRELLRQRHPPYHLRLVPVSGSSADFESCDCGRTWGEGVGHGSENLRSSSIHKTHGDDSSVPHEMEIG